MAAKKAAPKPARIAQNGITRPDGGTTGAIWDIADKISATNKAPASRAEVIAETDAAGFSRGTASTQYQRWRVFNGVADRVAAPKKAKTKAAAKKAKPQAAAKKSAKKATKKKKSVKVPKPPKA